MFATIALAAAVTAGPIVSTEWLAANLANPQIRVIYVGDRGNYELGHIPGARLLAHEDTLDMSGSGHRLASRDALIRTFTQAGVADGTHVVLYGSSPMATGWVYSALAAIGHGDAVSWLDGGFASWQAEKRQVETTTPAPGRGPLTARPAPDIFVDAAWVRSHLESPKTKLLDVRTQREWDGGRIPGATPILWQDLFANPRTQQFKSKDEIKALLARAGVGPDHEVVTYCAVGMRASLMAWAARSVGVPAKVYLGSWQEWSRDSTNPIVK